MLGLLRIDASAVDDAGDVWEDMEGGGGETGV